MIVLQIIVFSLGFLIAVSTLFSATKQTVLPGRKKVRLSRMVFRTSFRLFQLVIVRIPSEQVRGTLSALNAPMSVMLLPLTWLILLMIGFTMMFWGVSELSLGTALSLSGAAITTEGFLAPQGGAQTTLYIMGGVIGLGIVGLLITFLPTVYSIYSQREEEVTRVAFRFGTPPSGVKVLEQSYRLGLAEELDQFWHTWEDWFTDMAETHISNTAHCLTKIFLSSLQASLFLRFGTGLSSKTATSLIRSGAVEEHGLHERERGRFFMRQAGMRSLSPQHTDRLLHISRGGERGKVVELSSKTRSASADGTPVPSGISSTETDATG